MIGDTTYEKILLYWQINLGHKIVLSLLLSNLDLQWNATTTNRQPLLLSCRKSENQMIDLTVYLAFTKGFLTWHPGEEHVRFWEWDTPIDIKYYTYRNHLWADLSLKEGHTHLVTETNRNFVLWFSNYPHFRFQRKWTKIRYE